MSVDPTLKQAILKAFRCQNSGNCCRREGYVYVDAPTQAAMAKKLNLDLPTFLESYTETKNGWRFIASPTFRNTCFLTCENTCSVYEARPKICQTYPDWPEIWESEASLQEEADSCPGLKMAIEQVRQTPGF
ncbi:MAG: YkgJ family cysteine cluster protein [Candidatus Margulisiibacteriota bacterium]